MSRIFRALFRHVVGAIQSTLRLSVLYTGRTIFPTTENECDLNCIAHLWIRYSDIHEHPQNEPLRKAVGT